MQVARTAARCTCGVLHVLQVLQCALLRQHLLGTPPQMCSYRQHRSYGAGSTRRHLLRLLLSQKQDYHTVDWHRSSSLRMYMPYACA